MYSGTAQAASFLHTAFSIGQQIIRGSLWQGDRCNWIGAESIRMGSEGDGNGWTYTTLGPDLYAGTSGIALFMAELAATTKDAAAKMVALGAIRHALARMDELPANARMGLFSGSPGILLAAVRVGMLLDGPELVEQARKRLCKLADDAKHSHEFDLIAGKAGAIAVLLVLDDLLLEEFAFELAMQLGDELIESADKTSKGWSWRSPSLPNVRNLTGLSHGAAGSAYALLELYAATGETRFLEAAQQAFLYEQTWYSKEDRNWPDFRRELGAPRGRKHRCLSFWCHGAPGVALSRLRAYELLQDERYKQDAEIACKTTAASLHAAMTGWTGNFSLCHGLAGNSDVLLSAKALLGSDNARDSLPEQVALYGMERYGDGKEAWPCGTHSGQAPGLMLGLAGIGHFYLRLSGRSTPSLLLLKRSEWQSDRQESREGRSPQVLSEPGDSISKAEM